MIVSGVQDYLAGVKAIWLNRDKKERDNTAKPDYETSNLNELHPILNSIE